MRNLVFHNFEYQHVLDLLRKIFKAPSSIFLLIAVFPGWSLAQHINIELAPFNSVFSDFAPVYYKEGVVFSTNRVGNLFEDDIDSLRRFYTDLFFQQIDSDNKYIGEPRLWSKELTTFLNEGPCVFTRDYRELYYTGNVEPEKPDKRQRIDLYKLGIFSTRYEGSKFQDIKPFPFNTSNSKFDCAHPALTPNNEMLVFASNRDRKNNMDLFYCIWENDRWSEPQNLGNNVNSSKTELFPYFNSQGVLFFASNRAFGRNDFDLYRCEFKNGKWSKPLALPFPINTKFDDFTYLENKEGTGGFISSNRTTAEDDIFSFEYQFPELIDCKKNGRQSFCYQIEEESLINLDSLPMVYEWDLGDGTKKKGISVKHCYTDTGKYVINLNIKDTTTNQIFVNVSQSELHIEKNDRPFILSPDTVLINTPFLFSVEDSDLRNDLFFWETNDGGKFNGVCQQKTFSTPGTRLLTLTNVPVMVDSMPVGKQHCVFKSIVVCKDEMELAQLRTSKKQINAPTAAVENKSTAVETRVFALDENMKAIEANDGLSGFTIKRQKSSDSTLFKGSFYAVPREQAIDWGKVYSESVNSNTDVRKITRLGVNEDELKDFLKKTLEGKAPTEPLPIIDLEKRAVEQIAETRETQNLHPDSLKIDKVISEKIISNRPAALLSKELELNEMLIDRTLRFSESEFSLSRENMQLLEYISVVLDIEPTLNLKIVGQTKSDHEQKISEDLFAKRFESIRLYLFELGVESDRLEAGIYTPGKSTGALMAVMADADFSNLIEFRLIFPEGFLQISE